MGTVLFPKITRNGFEEMKYLGRLCACVFLFLLFFSTIHPFPKINGSMRMIYLFLLPGFKARLYASRICLLPTHMSGLFESLN